MSTHTTAGPVGATVVTREVPGMSLWIVVAQLDGAASATDDAATVSWTDADGMTHEEHLAAIK